MTVAEIANATTPVAAKLRRRNRRRSAMGAAAAMRSSYITNAAKATAAPANRATRRCQLLCVNTSEGVRAQDGRHEYGGAGERTGKRSGGSAAPSGVLRRSNVQDRRGWGAVDR